MRMPFAHTSRYRLRLVSSVASLGLSRNALGGRGRSLPNPRSPCGNVQEGWGCSLSRSPEAARALIADLGRILGDAGLRGALIGGQAVNCWVEPRITMDIDVTVLSDGDAIRNATRLFQEAGFAVALQQDLGGASGPDFVRLEHQATAVPVDIQVAKTEFEGLIIGRAVRAPGLAVPIATKEDLLVLKLLASRHKDFKDLLDLGKLPDIDWGYVEHWCEVWEVADRLENLRRAIAQDQQPL